MIARRKTRQIRVGAVPIGGGAPISVQSMTKTLTEDVHATIEQILSLAGVGCEIVRVAVRGSEARRHFWGIVRESPIPVIADIHFDHRLALAALEAGVAGLRINPGNIGKREHVEKVVRAAKERGVSIRIGVNLGSLEKPLLEKVRAGKIRTQRP